MAVPLRKTRAIIDLDAIAHNITTLLRRTGDVPWMALLKSDAYGHGDVMTARLADELGAFAGGVAALAEVEALRHYGVSLPLFLLEDLFPDEIEAALSWNVKLTVSAAEYARQIERVAAKTGADACIHVNVDTGMGRLGVKPESALSLLAQVHASPHLRLEGVYTHFPAADERDKEFTREQVGTLSRLVQDARRQGIAVPFSHAANSAAVIDLPRETALDLVRPGLAMYGMLPSKDVDARLPLRAAMTLVSSLIKVDTFPPGWSIGYGRTFTPRRESRIGVLPIGYGDGYTRALSHNADVLIRGQRAPVVGRVSMDMITVDLTDLPGTVSAGEEAVLLGEQTYEGRHDAVTAEEISRRAGTIPYEVTCLIGRRVPRVFRRRGKTVAVRGLTGYREEPVMIV